MSMKKKSFVLSMLFIFLFSFVSAQNLASSLSLGSAGIVEISAFLPLLIAFFFISNFKEQFLRKVFWIFLVVIFLAMWGARYDDVGAFSWMYFWSAVVCLIFFWFDGTIARARLRSEMRETGRHGSDLLLSDLRQRLLELEKKEENGVVSQDQYRRMKRHIQAQIRDVIKHNPRYS
jgi:hypothetical protein